MDQILGRFGAFIVQRNGTDLDKALEGLSSWKDNISVVSQPILNDISSTKIRQLRHEDRSIQYLTPPAVVEYIVDHGLHKDIGKS